MRSSTWTTEGDLLLQGARPLAGRPLTLERLRPEARADVFGPAAAGRLSLRAALVYANRAMLGGALLVFAGYVALLVPGTRPARAVLAVLFLFPVAGLAALWCTTLLQVYERRGLAAEGGALCIAGLGLVALDRAFARRGLRNG